MNIYAPNNGADRVELFLKMYQLLQSFDSEEILVVGGDWNCTLDFTLDRNGSEPHPKSAKSLAGVIKQLNLTDVWRDKNPSVKQYSWVKAGVGGVYSARLDRFYISKLAGNRVLYTNICPSALSDHNLITTGIILSMQKQRSPYWHFNVKLLQDESFCENFCIFWGNWRELKEEYSNLTQ